jgi:hypothetical protein
MMPNQDPSKLPGATTRRPRVSSATGISVVWRELVSTHEFADCRELVCDDPLAGVVHIADHRQAMLHRHRADHRYIKIISVQQIWALARSHHLHMVTGFRQRIEKYPRRRRMQREFGLLNPN